MIKIILAMEGELFACCCIIVDFKFPTMTDFLYNFCMSWSAMCVCMNIIIIIDNK